MSMSPPSILHCWCNKHKPDKKSKPAIISIAIVSFCEAQWKMLWRTLGHRAFLLLSFPCLPLFFSAGLLIPFSSPRTLACVPWLCCRDGPGRPLYTPLTPGLLLLLLHPNVLAWVNTPPFPHILLLFISFTDLLPSNLCTFSAQLH